MAYTGSFLVKSTFGDKKISIIRVAASATEENIDCGMDVVDGWSMAPQSMTTSRGIIHMNVNSTGTVAAGYLGASNLTATDVFIITAFGH